MHVPFSKGETMASISENNLWSAFSETGQLSVTSTADLHSPSSVVSRATPFGRGVARKTTSSAVCDVLNVIHVRMASLEDNLWSAFSETGLSFPQLSVTSTADLHSPSSAVFSL